MNEKAFDFLNLNLKNIELLNLTNEYYNFTGETLNSNSLKKHRIENQERTLFFHLFVFNKNLYI